jgi:hypothetical protein
VGKATFGIPEATALELRDHFGLNYFVETGSFKGGTAVWASQHFDYVWSIENYRDYHQYCLERHGHLENVQFVLGDSRKYLRAILFLQSEAALVWLDAHWLDKGKGRRADDCPLMDELKAIREASHRHIVMIDDAHFFEGDLPDGSDPAMWPSMDDIEAALPGHRLSVVDDVIIALPKDD